MFCRILTGKGWLEGGDLCAVERAGTYASGMVLIMGIDLVVVDLEAKT